MLAEWGSLKWRKDPIFMYIVYELHVEEDRSKIYVIISIK
jgi:hypothetical protein